MPISASYLVVLLGAGTLFSAYPTAPPLSPAPSDSRPADPKPDDATLPPPRADGPALPSNKPGEGASGTIVEEPAPAPHELPTGTVAGPVPVPLPQSSREEVAPMPREQTPAPGRFWMPGAPRDAALSDVDSLHREIETLRSEREHMLAEETDLLTAKDLHDAKRADANVQKHIAEMLVQVAQQAKKAKEQATTSPQQTTAKGKAANDPRQTTDGAEQRSGPNQSANAGGSPVGPKEQSQHPTPPAIATKPSDDNAKVVTEAPVDPLGLAQSLFRAGDYAAALNSYRKLDKEEQKPEDRVAIQYMTACCLRKLSKVDEASVLYREVANSPGNDFLMENAQWYLRTMKERRELETQLDELRQRRQSMKSRKL